MLGAYRLLTGGLLFDRGRLPRWCLLLSNAKTPTEDAWCLSEQASVREFRTSHDIAQQEASAVSASVRVMTLLNERNDHDNEDS